jgi:hypothetical protein
MGWLLEGDPAIRWQTMRDLRREPKSAVAAERARVATEGWGAALLAMQKPGGWWEGERWKTWMPTMDALALLREMGVDPSARPVRNALGRVRSNVRWHQLDGRPFFEGETEACINGAILAAGAYFGEDTHRLVERLLSGQLADGGWNCEAPPSRVSSFHSTIRVLEGLLEHEKTHGARKAVTEARRRGQDYLLRRRMLRSRRTGEIVDRRWMRLAFPNTWHYDVLRGLDSLRRAGVRPGARTAEAAEIVAKRRHQNKRWPQNVVHPDRLGLVMEPGRGRASRWLTLKAMRVLEWAGK